MKEQENQVDIIIKDNDVRIPHEFYMNKRLFQKWFLADYLERFNELPELLMPIRKSLLKDNLADKEKYFKKVCEAVSTSMYGEDESHKILGKSRTRDIVSMRKIVCYILVRKMNFPITAVAKLIGKNHATVIYLCKCTENHLEFDKQFQKSFIDIENNLLKFGIVWQ